jgi:hypothetical protein
MACCCQPSCLFQTFRFTIPSGTFDAIPRAIEVSTDFGFASGRSTTTCWQPRLAPLLRFGQPLFFGNMNLFSSYCPIPACASVGNVIPWEIAGSWSFTCSGGVWKLGLYSEANSKRWNPPRFGGPCSCGYTDYQKMTVSATITIPTDGSNLPAVGSYSATSPAAPGDGYAITYSQQPSEQFCTDSWPSISQLPEADYSGPQAVTSFSIVEY